VKKIVKIVKKHETLCLSSLVSALPELQGLFHSNGNLVLYFAEYKSLEFVLVPKKHQRGCAILTLSTVEKSFSKSTPVSS